MAKIGLLPGGFKPPHIGHYKTALEALKRGLDRIIVYVGKGSSATKLTTKAPRTAISQDLSIEMWEAFKQGDKDIEIEKSDISPIANVYDFIDDEAEDDDELYFIKGERDLESARFANIPQHAKEVGKTITVDYINIPEQTTDSGNEISGTLMRNYALGDEEQYQTLSDKGRKITRVKFSGKNTNKEKFFDGLPNKIGDNKKEYFWNKITGLEEKLFSQNWWSNQLSEVFSDNQATINDQLIPLEIMTTPEEQMRGMMGRDSLDGGMLFPYGEAGERSFHMQNCKIPLDIIFITQGKITNISPDCPPCLEDECPQYTGVADNVLELPGGYSQQNNINIGDHIKFNPLDVSDINAASKTLTAEEEQPYGDTTAYRDHWKSNDPGPKKPVEPAYKYKKRNFPFSSMYEDHQVGRGKFIHIYDFDDTITNTKTPIPTELPNGDVLTIHSDEFTDIVPDLEKKWGKENIKYDFSQFATRISNAIKNKPIIKKLKDSLSDNSVDKVTILTARAHGLPVTQYLSDYLGLDAYVVALGGIVPGGRVTGQDKANWVAKKIEGKYKTIRFIDDDEENRKAVKALEKKYKELDPERYKHLKIDVEDPPEIPAKKVREVRLLNEQSLAPPGILPLNPLHNGSMWSHFVGIICPAKLAMFHTGLPIADIQNWVWLNQQYAIAGIPQLPPTPNPNSTFGVTQMFTCFQVSPASETWWTPPNPTPLVGSFANLPQIQGLYANIQQGVVDGWMTAGPITNCQQDCISLAVNYDPSQEIPVDDENNPITTHPCLPPPGGCPIGVGGVPGIWQGYPYCFCLSPSVEPPTDDHPVLTHHIVKNVPCDHYNSLPPVQQITFCHQCFSAQQSGGIIDPECVCCRGFLPFGSQGGNLSKRSLTNKQKTRLFSKDWWSNIIKEHLLTEGGAAGHMNHPFDDRDLTFAEMKELVHLSLQGKLNIESDVTEKTDGQNLAVTYKNGEVGAARNKATVIEPLNKVGIADKFKDRGDITIAFTHSMRDLENALKNLSPETLNNIFQEGTRFLNMEIIYPATKNVITYGSQAYLQFHGIDEFIFTKDKEGKINKVEKGNSYGVPEELKALTQNVNARTQDTFEIIPPKIITTKAVRDFDKKEPEYINKINALQKEFALQDSDEVVMYHQRWWENKINNEFPNASDEVKSSLVRRWAYFEKSFRLNNKTIPDPETLQKAINFDKESHAKQNKENVYQFEKIFLELGTDVLANIDNYLAVNPKESVKELRNDIQNVIKQIQSSNDLEVLDKLKYQLKRIEDMGGFDKLVPSEGIVFIYKGKTYKLTGLFAAVNQLLGLTKYV